MPLRLEFKLDATPPPVGVGERGAAGVEGAHLRVSALLEGVGADVAPHRHVVHTLPRQSRAAGARVRVALRGVVLGHGAFHSDGVLGANRRRGGVVLGNHPFLAFGLAPILTAS